MKEKMIKAFEEVIKRFGNVETFILIVADEKEQLAQMRGKCKKSFACLAAEDSEFMEMLESAITTAKMQIKLNELIAEVEKMGITLSRMDDEAEVEAVKE